MGRILVADDEKQILSVMVDVLENAGHNVVGVADGEEAMKQLLIEPFDLVVIDVMMPKLDGYHLAQQIHGLKQPPPIVIVTSRNFDHDRAAVTAAGVDAFLSKPFSNKDLLEVVTTLLARKRPR